MVGISIYPRSWLAKAYPPSYTWMVMTGWLVGVVSEGLGLVGGNGCIPLDHASHYIFSLLLYQDTEEPYPAEACRRQYHCYLLWDKKPWQQLFRQQPRGPRVNLLNSFPFNQDEHFNYLQNLQLSLSCFHKNGSMSQVWGEKPTHFKFKILKWLTYLVLTPPFWTSQLWSAPP